MPHKAIFEGIKISRPRTIGRLKYMVRLTGVEPATFRVGV